MAEVNQSSEDPNSLGIDNSQAQSISAERNSKGYNFKVRVVLQPGEDMAKAHTRLMDEIVRCENDLGNRRVAPGVGGSK